MTMTMRQGLHEDTYVAAAITASECLANLQRCFVEQYPTSQALRRLAFAHLDDERISLTVSGNRNWEKGIPFGRLIQSAIRHMIRWMKGDRSEDHLAAVCWNVMAMIHFEETGQAQEWNNYPAYKRDELHEPRRSMAEPDKPDPFHRDYKIIAVDFDGCLCESKWPEIGKPNLGAIWPLLHRQDKGDKLILWTCREGKALQDALEWCGRYGLKFDAVNANLPEMNAMYGNDSRKIGADEYWDDKAVTVKA